MTYTILAIFFLTVAMGVANCFVCIGRTPKKEKVQMALVGLLLIALGLLGIWGTTFYV